jgi:hypothetical protein
VLLGRTRIAEAEGQDVTKKLDSILSQSGFTRASLGSPSDHSLTMSASSSSFDASFGQVIQHVLDRYHSLDRLPTTPAPSSVAQTISSLPAALPSTGLGTSETTNYLIDTLLPGILQGQPGPRYFGFVTGGVTEAAQLADILGGSYDENVQVTLPGVTASTAAEARALEMVLDLMDIPRMSFEGRTITTGATASNVLGLGE